MKTVLLSAALLLACVFGPAAFNSAAAEPALPQLSTLRVTGSAEVSAKPDHAEIDAGVITQSATAAAAASGNAAQVQAVLAALHRALGEHADIKTVSYGLAPLYRAPAPGEEPAISGYTATHIVRITLDDLDKTGPALDAATHAGANHVQDIRFTLRDEQPVRKEALRQAATRAKAEADTLANALGVRILRVLSVEEDGTQLRPVRPLVAAPMARAQVATPIEAGTLDVSATVTLTVEIGP